ncbi:MAG: flagellar basal body-associated FliL family protein [Planctomycetes bacterium]|nr:flagellar basal body-associated FliL family protein [Planctomycetota bacterium]
MNQPNPSPKPAAAPVTGAPAARWPWFVRWGLVVGFSWVLVQLLFPRDAAMEALEQLESSELAQVEIPGEIVADLRGGQGERLVLRVALDFRASDEQLVRKRLKDPAILNRVRDRLNEFYTGRSAAEVADPALRPMEKRELRSRLSPLVFPDPEEGRVEEVLFALRSIEG